MQVVIIGGIKKEMKRRLDRIIREHRGKNTEVLIRGFIDNVSEYLAASDVIAGRAGINTIVEAIYAHRPFLITELVYIVIHSAEYVEKYGVGWNATGDRDKQIAIIRSLVTHPENLAKLDENFSKVPIEYSAQKLARIVADDAALYGNHMR